MEGSERASVLTGLMLIALAAVSWGTTGSVSATLAARGAASALLVGLVRMWLAAGVLALMAMSRGPLTLGREARGRSLLTGLAMAAYQVCFFSAVPLAGIAVVALVAICSAPLIITVLGAVCLGERVTRRDTVALVLGVAGAALLIRGSARADAAAAFGEGALLALGAGLAYAVYVVTTKATVDHARPLPLAAATFTVAALALTPTLAWIDAPARQIEAGWAWLLYLGVVPTGAAYAMYTSGLRTVPASVAGIVGLLEPLTATLLGVVVFGERLGTTGAAGAVSMGVALVLLVTRATR